MMLASYGWRDGRVTKIALSYGHLLDTGAPLIEVMTRIGTSKARGPSLAAEVLHRERRDAAIERGDLEGMAGDVEETDEREISPDEEKFEDRDIIAVGNQMTVSVITYKRYQALHFNYQSFSVRVVSRNYPVPRLLSFEFIDDLEPYFRGHIRLLVSLIRFRPSRPADA